MAADEVRTVFIEMDYQEREMAKDFSIVAWGDTGPITLTHMGGLSSMSFTELPDDADPEELEA